MTLTLPELKSAVRDIALRVQTETQSTLDKRERPRLETFIKIFSELETHCRSLCDESFTRLVIAMSDDLCQPLLSLYTGRSPLRFHKILMMVLWDVLRPDKPGVHSIYPKNYLEVMPGSPWFSQRLADESILDRPMDDTERRATTHVGLITRKTDNEQDEQAFLYIQSTQLPLFPQCNLEISTWFTTVHLILSRSDPANRRAVWFCMRWIAAPSLLRGRLPRWFHDFVEYKLAASSPFKFPHFSVTDQFIKLFMSDLKGLLAENTREETCRRMMVAYSDGWWLSEFSKYRLGRSFNLGVLAKKLEERRIDGGEITMDVKESIKRVLLMGETDVDPNYRILDLLRCLRALPPS